MLPHPWSLTLKLIDKDENWPDFVIGLFNTSFCPFDTIWKESNTNVSDCPGVGLVVIRDVGVGLVVIKDVGVGLVFIKDVGAGLVFIKDVGVGLVFIKDVGVGEEVTKEDCVGFNDWVGLGVDLFVFKKKILK